MKKLLDTKKDWNLIAPYFKIKAENKNSVPMNAS